MTNLFHHRSTCPMGPVGNLSSQPSSIFPSERAKGYSDSKKLEAVTGRNQLNSNQHFNQCYCGTSLELSIDTKFSFCLSFSSVVSDLGGKVGQKLTQHLYKRNKSTKSTMNPSNAVTYTVRRTNCPLIRGRCSASFFLL